MDNLFSDITDDMQATFNEIYKKGDEQSLELAIKKIKNIGCSQMQSLKILMLELDLDFKECDNLILNSEAWAPERPNNIQFRDEFAKYLKR